MVRELVSELYGVHRESLTDDSRLSTIVGSNINSLADVFIELERRNEVMFSSREIDSIVTLGDLERAVHRKKRPGFW